MTGKRITDEDSAKLQEETKKRLLGPYGHYEIMVPQPMCGKSLAAKWVKENYPDITVMEKIPSNLKGNAPTPLKTVMKYLSENENKMDHMMTIEDLTNTISEWIKELEEEEGKKVPIVETNESTLIFLITLLYQYSMTGTPISTQILRFIHEARDDDGFEKIFNQTE